MLGECLSAVDILAKSFFEFAPTMQLDNTLIKAYLAWEDHLTRLRTMGTSSSTWMP